MSEIAKELVVFRSLYPGTVVDIEDDDGKVVNKATVYPMGFIHVQKFSKDLTFAISALTKVAIPANASEEQKAAAIMGQMIPYIVNNLLELIEECVVFKDDSTTMSSLAHWDVPPLIEAWVMESFGKPKKWKPWIQATERVLNQILKPEKPIEILAMLSKASSPQDSASTKSSTKETPISRTPDGASSSSSTS